MRSLFARMSLCLILVSIASFNSFASSLPAEIISPIKGEMQYSFTEIAKTQLAHVYEVNMPIDGVLQRIMLLPGDKVKKNEAVAQIDQTVFSEEINQMKGKMMAIEALYQEQQQKWQRRSALTQKGFETKSELDTISSMKKAYSGYLTEAAASLAISEYHLSQSTIRSPIDGIVLSLGTQGGKWLPTGAPIMKVGTISDIEVISDLLTQDAERLRVGDVVIFSSIGNSTTLYGKVKRIDPAGFTKKSSLGVDEQRVHVITSINHPETAHLGVGYQLEATFLVGEKKTNVLIVPRFSVLQDANGKFYVFKVIKNKLHKQIITTGITTDRNIEVTSGLTTQDKILAQPTSDMKDGMAI